jgi:hypothetical protein
MPAHGVPTQHGKLCVPRIFAVNSAIPEQLLSG